MEIQITRKFFNKMFKLVPEDQLDFAKVYLLAKNKEGVLCDMLYLRRRPDDSCYAMSHINANTLHTSYNRLIKKNLSTYGLCRINKCVTYGWSGGWDGDGGSAIHDVPRMISISKDQTRLVIENGNFECIPYEVI